LGTGSFAFHFFLEIAFISSNVRPFGVSFVPVIIYGYPALEDPVALYGSGRRITDVEVIHGAKLRIAAFAVWIAAHRVLPIGKGSEIQVEPLPTYPFAPLWT
jgi:hypothetical protein